MSDSDDTEKGAAPVKRFEPVSLEERRRIADEADKRTMKRIQEVQELIRQGKPLPKVH